MNQDEIIEQVRAVREELAARHDYDVRALYEEAKQRERQGERQVVKLLPRLLAKAPEESA